MKKSVLAGVLVASWFVAGAALGDDTEPGILTISHPLQVGHSSGSAITNSEADSIIAAMSALLGQCNSTAFRQNNVSSTSAPNSINSNADLASACGSSLIAETQGMDDVAPLGTPRRVRVVNAINWCSKIQPNVVGCAPTPGVCMVVKRLGNSEGILWAHEFGHSKGLPHRTDDPAAVMQPSLTNNMNKFNQSECNALRTLGFFEFNHWENIEVSKVKVAVANSIEDFVMATHVDGISYQEARQFTSADVARVTPWLMQNNKMAFWANIVAVAGIVADNKASKVLRDHINRPATGDLHIDDYSSRTSAIISLGYVVYGNNDSAARTFLQSHLTPQSWATTTWKAPYQSTDAERNADLAAAATLGVGLIGGPQASDELKAVAEKLKGDTATASLLEALKQASDANAIITEKGLSGYYAE